MRGAVLAIAATLALLEFVRQLRQLNERLAGR
jgi:hypothetical protein